MPAVDGGCPVPCLSPARTLPTPAMLAARSTKSAGKRRKLPITLELLAAMLHQLAQEGGWVSSRDACFFLLSWFG